jgi:hypothetical protein
MKEGPRCPPIPAADGSAGSACSSRGRGRARGGTAGQAHDPCYHQACDTYANNNEQALDVNSDAVAYATLRLAMNTADINGTKSKGNFKVPPPGPDPEHDPVTQ